MCELHFLFFSRWLLSFPRKKKKIQNMQNHSEIMSESRFLTQSEANFISDPNVVVSKFLQEDKSLLSGSSFIFFSRNYVFSFCLMKIACLTEFIVLIKLVFFVAFGFHIQCMSSFSTSRQL